MSEEWGDVKLLRLLGEQLTDAINYRTRAENRARAYGMLGGKIMVDGKEEPIVEVSRENEDLLRIQLRTYYQQIVPDRIRAWASTVPGLASGELFPRIISMIGNPRHAIPLKMEGTGKNRKAVPDGDPYDRTLRQLWQWCGCGDPDSVPIKHVLGHSPSQAELLRAGKRTVVRPLLYTWSSYLMRVSSPVTKEGSKYFGRPMSEDAASCEFWKIFREAKTEGQNKRHNRTCRNTKVPPMSPNGCGIAAHPEWGEVGSPWRPGHILMHAHRITQKELLRALWVAGE